MNSFVVIHPIIKEIKNYMKKLCSGLLMIILSSSLIACNNNSTEGSNESMIDTTNKSVEDFEKAISKEGCQILDVRSMEEYQSGHLKNALLADWSDNNEFMYRVQSLDKSRPVYAYCFSGARSSRAAAWLRDKGFIAYNLDGGIAAWKRENKPLEGNANVKQISMQEYRSFIPTDKIVLVDISASWCPPCKKMEPIVDSLSKSANAHFIFVKIDGGEQNSIVQELSITAFPTFIIYRNGKEYWRKSGIVSAEELTRQLN